MVSYIWPLAIIVLSNIFYQVCAKGIPSSMDPFASMTITYFVGTICSAILYFVVSQNGNLLSEYGKTNWAPALLGLCIVGLEVGFIYAYKVGWPVSTLSIVQSAFVAGALLFVGWLLYHEAISLSKVVGIVICLIGLYFINK